MKKIIPAVVLSLGFCTPSFAQDVGLLKDDFKVSYYGEVSANAVSHPEYNYNYTNAWLSLGVEWKNKVRAVLTTSLTTILEDNKIKLEDDFSLEEFITEAYIEIKEVGGSPVAIIVGKRSIPFVKSIEAMPVFGNNPLSEEYDIDEVFGLTVKLDKGLFGIFDSAELSVFETDAGDMSIGTINGVSVKLSKELTKNVALNAALVSMDRDDNPMGTEGRAILGVITKSNDGDLVGWVNGMLFSNNPKFPNSDFALTAGAKVQVTGSTDVVVEMTYVEKEVIQYAIGSNTALTSRITVGAEVRYNDYQDAREDEIVFGLNARYTFGVDGYAPNDEYLFGDE
ncbi:MAG: hypothetical protein K9K67_15295 [Bacteriovoracaceae bacterium]|nr:hypothetical protein [Bacteriovoracaceae bacterium]